MSLNIQFLVDMLAQDKAAVEELTNLLLKERELLEQRKLEGMQEIVNRKDYLLSNLSYSAKQREQLLIASGLSTDLVGWEAFLLKEPSTRFLITDWQKLSQAFVECQKANEINGKMINRSKQTLSHLLNLLRGQVAAPSLYNQKGASSHYSNTHTVIKA